VAAAFKPATVSETKAKFLQNYARPIPSIYSTVVNELLVQMHFITYGIKYQYNEVSGPCRAARTSPHAAHYRAFGTQVH
jgi:hypothetical protein